MDGEDALGPKDLSLSSLSESKSARMSKFMKKYLVQPLLIGFSLAFGMSVGLYC